MLLVTTPLVAVQTLTHTHVSTITCFLQHWCVKLCVQIILSRFVTRDDRDAQSNTYYSRASYDILLLLLLDYAIEIN